MTDDRERKETADLLAGFDIPARHARSRPATRDFVDYHVEKERPGPAPRREPPEAIPHVDTSGRDQPTAIIRRRKQALPSWALLSGAVVAMAVAGAGLAAIFARRSPQSVATTATASGATTTIPLATATANAIPSANATPSATGTTTATTTPRRPPPAASSAKPDDDLIKHL